MFARVPIAQSHLMPLNSIAAFRPLQRRPETLTVLSRNFADLTRIYDDPVNLCLIERPLPDTIEQFVQTALQAQTSLEISHAVNPQRYDFGELWPQAASLPGYEAWTTDVAWLTSAYCDLFGLSEAGLRIRTLDKAMCPRFHIDRVPARMICSYGGIGTEWLPEYALDRTKLGMGACGQPDDRSGLILDPTAIRQMSAYAVGLMKGENWPERW